MKDAEQGEGAVVVKEKQAIVPVDHHAQAGKKVFAGRAARSFRGQFLHMSDQFSDKGLCPDGIFLCDKVVDFIQI